jgi:hypothetical protein
MIQQKVTKLKAGEAVICTALPGYCLVICPRYFKTELPAGYFSTTESLEAFMPLQMVDTLHLHVNQVPDLAWDLMEYAEKPLILCLQGLKNLGEDWDGPEAVMGFCRLQEDELSSLARAIPHPLLAFPVSGSLSKPCLKLPEGHAETTEYPALAGVKNYKVLFLSRQGGLQWLRKG